MKTCGKFTAIVGNEKYLNIHIHGFGDTAEEAIESCMNQIIPIGTGEDEVIVGYWTRTGVLPASNIWLRHTKPTSAA